MDLSPEDAIKKYDIPIDTTPVKPDELSKCSYVLIRHGLSAFNYRALVAKTDFGEDSEQFKAVENDQSGEDPELHPIGILQCEHGQPAVNAINFKVVFTSPMQRAMMTTIHMFKNHPNKDNIKFVVMPIIREVLHTTNDIAMDCEELMKKYGDDQPGNHGIKFDFSRLYLYGIPQLWQIYTVANVGLQQAIIQQLKKVNPEPNHLAPQKTNYIEVMKETLPKYKPRFEDCSSLLRRGAVAKEFMREYLRINPLKDDEKYCLSTHSMFIATMTAGGLDENDKMGFKDYVWTQNCQLLPYLQL